MVGSGNCATIPAKSTMSRMDLIGRSSSLVRTSPFRPYTPKDSFRKSPPLNSSATKTKIASADKDADPGTLAYYFQNKDSKPEKNEIEEPKELSVSPIKRRASLKRKVIVDDDDEEDEVKVESKSEKKLTALKSENIFSYGTLISKDSAKLTPEAPRVRKIRPSLDREVVEEMHNSVHLSKEVEADNAKRTPTSIEDGQLKLSKFFVNRTSRSPIVQKNSVIQPKNQETLHSHLFQASTSGQQLYAKMNKRRFGLKNLGNTC